jgi:hypothetical protein
VPSDVAVFVMSLTAKDPAWRPGSAAEVSDSAARLRDGLGARPDATWPFSVDGWPGLPPDVPLTTAAYSRPFPYLPSHPLRAGRRRRRGVVAVAALALAALAGLVLLTMTGFASGRHPAVQPSSTSSSARQVPSAPASHGHQKGHHRGTDLGNQDGDAQAGD